MSSATRRVTEGDPMRATPDLRLLDSPEAPSEQVGEQAECATAAPFSELELFVRREMKLREELKQQIAAYQLELAAARKSAAGSGELDDRAAQLAAAEQELAGRVAAIETGEELAEATRVTLEAEERRLAELAREVDARALKVKSARNRAKAS